MGRNPEQISLLRALTWYETIGYAPTRVELAMTRESVENACHAVVTRHLDELIREGAIIERMGRIGFPASLDRTITTIRERDMYQPRKRRRARRVASWLARLGSVRFVALANTTALGFARDEGDLDIFVIARAGMIWTTRLLGGLPFRLLGITPRAGNSRDAVCLSYFVSDDALDLSSHQLSGDDPYFRYWFLSLLPLYDDGVSVDLWNTNATLRARHPFARPWIVPPDLRIDSGTWNLDPRRCMSLARLTESVARSLQMRWFPPVIRNQMNRDTTVIVNDHALKFHVSDRRAVYRRTYNEVCKMRGIEP